MTEHYPKIKRNRARCKVCDVMIESKHRHDFVSCPGKHVFLDGGKDYVRSGGELKAIEYLTEYEEGR